MASYFEEFTSQVIGFLPKMKNLGSVEDSHVEENYNAILKEYDGLCTKLESVGYSEDERRAEASAVFEYALRKYVSSFEPEGGFGKTDGTEPPKSKRRKTKKQATSLVEACRERQASCGPLEHRSG